MFPNGETVTITRPGGPTGERDDLGNPIIEDPTTFDIEDVGVAPLTPQESMELFGEMNIDGFTLYLPSGTDLRTTDQATVRGGSGYQMQGGSINWVSPFTGWEPGDVAIVRRAS